jgi:hypothetical protein
VDTPSLHHSPYRHFIGDSNPDGAVLCLSPPQRGLKSGRRFSLFPATATGDSNPAGAASSQSRHLNGDSYPDGDISLLLGHLFRLPTSGRPHLLPAPPLHNSHAHFCTARFSQEVVLVNIFPLFYDFHQAPSTEQSWTLELCHSNILSWIFVIYADFHLSTCISHRASHASLPTSVPF